MFDFLRPHGRLAKAEAGTTSQGATYVEATGVDQSV
jgi:hypothetical protein